MVLQLGVFGRTTASCQRASLRNLPPELVLPHLPHFAMNRIDAIKPDAQQSSNEADDPEALRKINKSEDDFLLEEHFVPS